MGRIGDVTCENAGKIVADLEGVQVPVADLDTLIATKGGLRPQDRADLELLLPGRPGCRVEEARGCKPCLRGNRTGAAVRFLCEANRAGPAAGF